VRRRSTTTLSPSSHDDTPHDDARAHDGDHDH
jgi:hypothetical protein